MEGLFWRFVNAFCYGVVVAVALIVFMTLFLVLSILNGLFLGMDIAAKRTRDVYAQVAEKYL